jgi:tetratricopeptide (TPR) repeat protein
MARASDPVATLDVALEHAQRLLRADPALAAQQAREILAVVPGQPAARRVLGAALRASGDLDGSLETLTALATQAPGSAVAHFELALSLAQAGRGDGSLAALERAVALDADFAAAWLRLADHRAAIGDSPGADAARAQHIRLSSRDPELVAAGAALCDGRIAAAEEALRGRLKRAPTDVAAIRMLAEVALRLGRNGDAEKLLTRAIELAPSFTPARHNLALALHRLERHGEALAAIEHALATEPRNPGYRNLQAAVLGRLGQFERAIGVYRSVLAEYPAQPKAWMSYGHALKAAGHLDEAIAAYRRSSELAPGFGEAWWSLANLKTVRFDATDVAAMRGQLARADLMDEDRLHFHFALGKALEDAADHAASFRHYAEGNRLRRAALRYDAAENTDYAERCRALFTPAFLDARAGSGAAAPDPIFVVGLPRSGSTLLEQILASHPRVEGTMELPDVIAIARELGGGRIRGGASTYPESLGALDRGELRELGERYLERTRIQRLGGRPLFVDKMPNNWLHVGLIHLMLPNAKIIDARRHPLGCCLSNFKQHFARGQAFTYSLDDIGRYYVDYVALMAHFDRVLPGRVHRVHHERLVEDPEGEIRRLLEYCGLPFDPACLRFHETERAVRTASSQQVRQPLNRDGVDQWRHYEAWLGPLVRALGPVLASYPSVPEFPFPVATGAVRAIDGAPTCRDHAAAS